MKILITGGSGFIGTNLTEALQNAGISYLNVDIKPPKIQKLKKNWVACDILDMKAFKRYFASYQPTAIIHLAAETNTSAKMTLADYRVNIEGTKNVIKLFKTLGPKGRLIHTSSQFVHQKPGGPSHDEDFAPHTVYGLSKVISEQALKKASVSGTWTIIRPTNVWGPWHPRYPFEFWKIIAEGKYIHPGKKRVTRSYGYVGNVVLQIIQILQKPRKKVRSKIYYLGDEPISLIDWVNGFSVRQMGRKVVIVPRAVIYPLAILGDILNYLGIHFPLNLSRYRSMTTDNPVKMSETFRVLGTPPYTLEQGLDATIQWLRNTHPNLVKV